MPQAFILGGTGQIGTATANYLTTKGWEVTLASRSMTTVGSEFQQVNMDRSEAGALERTLGAGTDLLLDCIAFEASHAHQLVGVQNSVGHMMVISSASVYRDAAGRTLDEAGECGFPQFQGPISESHPTVAPGTETYSTRKVAVEQVIKSGARIPATILRPCAIHGPFNKHAREWWFVKRLLDGRKRIPLAYCGQSQFQTTSVRAIAKAVDEAANFKGFNTFNVKDADAPSVAEIGQTIMNILGMSAELVCLPETADYPPDFGGTPWSAQRPMICASSLTNDETYADTVAAAIEWLIASVDRDAWQNALPQLAAYPKPHFDYAQDNRALGLSR